MFLTIKKIPKKEWSSNNPFILKPKIKTFLYLCFGLFLFGLGEGLLVVSLTGTTPWTVLAQGISQKIGFSVGVVTFFISLTVLFFWIFLDVKPGLGTIFNALIIALMLDLTILYVPTPESYLFKLLLAIFAIFIVGLGSGIYLICNLGPGPRDGLMTGLQKKTNLPIALVRALIEIIVASVGWYLGGNLGVGTLLFAFGIGPAVAFGLYIVDRTA